MQLRLINSSTFAIHSPTTVSLSQNQVNMSSWFSFGSKISKEANNEPQSVRALPASWYRSEVVYSLERRAIFSKKWLVVTHQSRFARDGDYIKITEAGFTFFLIKDRNGEIRAHHNVCRHRAYPLVEKDSGHLHVLACKYHGTCVKTHIPGWRPDNILTSNRLVLWFRWRAS